MKNSKKALKKGIGRQKGHKPLPNRIHTIWVLGWFCLTPASFCQEATSIEAGVSGSLNCINTTVTLQCVSDVEGATYKWEGPNGFISTSKSPVTALPGIYVVNVTNPSTGSISRAGITVTLDTIRPEGVKVVAPGTLTCKDTLVTLTATSATPGVNYEWMGPGRFVSYEKVTKTTSPGNYQLSVVNPVNGCITKSSLGVIQNIKPPKDVTATTSGVLTCKNKSVRLTGVSSTQKVNYFWTGPGFSGESNEHPVSVPGDYHVKVTDPVNGCSSTAQVAVLQNQVSPKGVMAEVSDTLTCTVHDVKLTASSATQRLIYEWSGPGGISSTENTLKTNVPGDYKLHVTDPENGCSVDKMLTVAQDTVAPAYVKVMSTGKFTCKDSAVVLACISPTGNIVYNWQGPDGFVSESVSPKVSHKGTYYVKATKKNNGCFVTRSIEVAEDISIPKNVMAKSMGVVTCGGPGVKLKGESSTETVNFAWSGPNDFQSDLKEPEIKVPGKYNLTVVDTLNGCKEETSVTVSGEVCMNLPKE